LWADPLATTTIHPMLSHKATKLYRTPLSGPCSTTAWAAGPCTPCWVWPWATSHTAGACHFLFVLHYTHFSANACAVAPAMHSTSSSWSAPLWALLPRWVLALSCSTWAFPSSSVSRRGWDYRLL